MRAQASIAHRAVSATVTSSSSTQGLTTSAADASESSGRGVHGARADEDGRHRDQ